MEIVSLHAHALELLPLACLLCSMSSSGGDSTNLNQWIFAARWSQIPTNTGLTVSVEGKRIALFRVEDRIHAIDDACPHMGSSLGAGDVHDGVVTCPWHGWRFRVADGAWVSCPNNRNRVYPTEVRDGQVFIDCSETKADEIIK